MTRTFAPKTSFNPQRWVGFGIFADGERKLLSGATIYRRTDGVEIIMSWNMNWMIRNSNGEYVKRGPKKKRASDPREYTNLCEATAMAEHLFPLPYTT